MKLPEVPGVGVPGVGVPGVGVPGAGVPGTELQVLGTPLGGRMTPLGA